MKYLKSYKLFEAITIDTKKQILDLLSQCKDSGWFGTNMKETFQCFRFDNEWFDILLKESGKDREDIINKIKENTVSLWEDNLEETFECVISEDVEDSSESIDYNGWYEDLLEYLKIKVSDKKEALLDYIKKEVVDMDFLYDIKEIAMDQLYDNHNSELSIVAYLIVESNKDWYTDFDQEKSKYPGKTNNVDFLDIIFNTSDEFETKFDLSYKIMSMFASNVDFIKDALSGEFKHNQSLKYIGIGYKVAILEDVNNFRWVDNEADRILEEESKELVDRIKLAYPDEKIEVGL
jgi:hypothetical protein